MSRALALALALVLMSAGAAAQSPAATSSDPVLAPMMRPGRVVDASRFTHRRAVRLYPSAAGVSSYLLAPADLAVARADLGDLRVVYGDSRQAPYVIVPRRHRMPVKVHGSERRGTETTHELELPRAPLTVVAVEIDVDRAYVARPYRLVASTPDGEITIASGVLERRSGERQPIPLLLAGDSRVEALRLVVDDGDDASLAITGGTVSVASAELRVVAPRGAYDLLLGAPLLEAPRYELRGVRERVLEAAAGEVQVGPLESNAAHVPRLDAPAPEPDDQALILWVAIALSVLILGALTFRVARAA